MSDSQTETQETSDTTIILSNAILFMLSLLVFNEILINYFQKLCLKFPLIKRFINNSILTTSLGLLAGVFLNIMDSNLIISEYRVGFSQFFLIILLPPILFESAVNMEKALFFQNFGSILLYALLGTGIATVLTGTLIWAVGAIGITNYLDLIHSFAFGALISATDPVAVLGLFKSLNADRRLYILIYGESILNDAIAIIIYGLCVQIQQGHIVGTGAAILQFLMIFIISILIGFIIGVICAYILKIKQALTYETEHIEVSVTIIMPWVCYLIAEAVGFSGIVSIVFCGIAMARYALPNLSENGKTLLNKFYHVLAYNFENLVFIFIGIGIIGFKLEWNQIGLGLIICSIIIVFLARFANIKIVSFILNLTRQDNFIKNNHQLAFWFFGLRGAMAYALSLDSVDKFDQGSVILTLTMFIVILNIYLQGSLLVTVMEFCKIEQDSNEHQIQNEDEPPQTHRSKGVFHKFKDCIERFDQKILQHYLIRKREQSPSPIQVERQHSPTQIADEKHQLQFVKEVNQ